MCGVGRAVCGVGRAVCGVGLGGWTKIAVEVGNTYDACRRQGAEASRVPSPERVSAQTPPFKKAVHKWRFSLRKADRGGLP